MPDEPPTADRIGTLDETGEGRHGWNLGDVTQLIVDDLRKAGLIGKGACVAAA